MINGKLDAHALPILTSTSLLSNPGYALTDSLGHGTW